jgi:cephalosporin hydroxylase
VESVCEAYHDWYYSQEIWKTTKFLDVVAFKSVADLWNYQEILTELKPSLVLEFGTYRGGSALYFAEVLKLVSAHSRVLTVDIDQSVVAERVRRHECIELLESDTTNPKVAARFKELRRAYPGKAFFIVDSDHNREHVIAELMLLRDVTEPGDYVVVEDGNINGHPVLPDWGPGPYEALQAYFERYPDDYISDVERERKFGFTFAPMGFLIRRDSGTERPPSPVTHAWDRRLEAQRQQRTDTERVLEQATSLAAHYKNLLDRQQHELKDAQTRLADAASLAEHYKNLLDEQLEQRKDAQNRLVEAASQAAHYKNLLDEQQQLRADAENRLRDRAAIASELEQQIAQEKSARETAEENARSLTAKLSRFPVRLLVR